MRQLTLLLSLLLLCQAAHVHAQDGPPASAPSSAPAVKVKAKASAGEDGRLHVLFTTDIYGRFAWPGCGQRESGRADLAHMVAAVKKKREQLRKAGEGEPLVLAGGSMIRPDVLGNHIFGEGRAWSGSAIRLLKGVGFHAVSVGPYDFGAHPDALKTYMAGMRGAKIPLLAGNVTCTEKDDFRCQHLGDDKGRRYTVLQRGNLRVGVVAITREDLPQRILKRSRGSIAAGDPGDEARKLLRLLRQQEKVDLTIVLATLNLESDAPAPVLSFVRDLGAEAPDLVVADAMFHRGSSDFIARIQSKQGSAIVGTDRFGQHLGHAVIRYRRTDKGVKVPLIDVTVEPVTDVQPDPSSLPYVQDMLRELCRTVDKPLGKARFDKPMKAADFKTYLMEIMRNKEGAEISFLNDSALADAAFDKGSMTREMVLRTIRTETQLGSAWITGERLKKLLTPFLLGQKEGLNWLGLEKQGLKWYVNKRLLIDGLHYRVAMTKFVANGGDGLIKLKTERFKDSGFSLRRTILDFFEGDGPSRIDEDPGIDLDKDFPDPWENWVFYGGSDVGLAVSNVSVGNGSKGDRYNKPLLTRDTVTSLKMEIDLSLGASNRNHALEADLSFLYGKTWTLTAEDEAAGKEATAAESADQIRADLLYRLNMLRNRQSPAQWYMPVPYAEATVISEFSADNTYLDVNAQEQTYHFVELGGTVGVGLLPHPYLFVKAGFAVNGELLTPDRALREKGEELDARTGLFLGYKLRRLKLISSVMHPLQLESRFDFFMYSPDRLELTLQSKLYFSLTPYLHLTAGHTLYLYDAPAKEVSVANDISMGLNFLLDYRHQIY